MKKPPQELIDAFFKWFASDPHSKNEDYYRGTISRDHLSKLSKPAFIDFFYKFANEGGQVQSGGSRTSGKFRETMESNYDQFRPFVLNPFDTDFDEAKWLAGTKAFNYFGVGLASIYLNRVDKKRFPILNKKAADSLALLGVSLPTDIIKRYQIVRDEQKQLITWFPQFDNYYRTDALAQFLIGDEAGRHWKELLEKMLHHPPKETSIWKVSHGKTDFSAEQRKTYLQQHTIHVHKDTKKGQGALFANEMREGDFFYLCHGNDDGVRVFGRLTGPPVSSPQGDGWLQRSYDVVFEGVKPSAKYTGVKKGWAPNYNSTCMAVPKEEINLFESNILMPFFGKRLDDIPGFAGISPSGVSLPSRNIILYGPPGTGKTYALRNEYMTRFAESQKEIKRYEYVTFHQSYSYEDFVEGIKPVMAEDVADTLTYEVKPGIFKNMVKLALDDPDHDYALLIDEINRGNVASIFGELIALIEDDKRKGELNELRAQLPYSRQEFVVPSNLYIIGAMNTADRSVEALDTALRRRFTFIAIPPQPELIQQPGNLEVDLQTLLMTINARIEKLLDKDHCIGHSYFMSIAQKADPLDELRKVFATKIRPLLEECFYGDHAKIGMVLGERFVTRKDEMIQWAKGDWGMDDFEERRVYALQDPMTLKVEDFQAVYE